MTLNFSLICVYNVNNQAYLFWAKCGRYRRLRFGDISCQSSRRFFWATRYVAWKWILRKFLALPSLGSIVLNYELGYYMLHGSLPSHFQKKSHSGQSHPIYDRCWQLAKACRMQIGQGILLKVQCNAKSKTFIFKRYDCENASKTRKSLTLNLYVITDDAKVYLIRTGEYITVVTL